MSEIIAFNDILVGDRVRASITYATDDKIVSEFDVLAKDKYAVHGEFISAADNWCYELLRRSRGKVGSFWWHKATDSVYCLTDSYNYVLVRGWGDIRHKEWVLLKGIRDEKIAELTLFEGEL